MKTPAPKRSKLIRKTSEQIRRPPEDELARLEAMGDGVPDDESREFTDEDFASGRVRIRYPITSAVKEPVSIRLDAELIEWFKAGGPGYQTRINEALREYKIASSKEDDPKAVLAQIDLLVRRLKRRLAS